MCLFSEKEYEGNMIKVSIAERKVPAGGFGRGGRGGGGRGGGGTYSVFQNQETRIVDNLILCSFSSCVVLSLISDDYNIRIV